MDLMDYRRKIIANSPHLASAEGAIASFSDGADLPLKSLIVDIEPVQSGSGDPSPSNIRPISGWNAVKVTRTRKNVFDNQFSNRTINGLTWVLNSDGTITVNGTATAETQLHTQFVSGIEGECYFSGCPSGGSSTSYDVFIWDVTNSRRAKKWDRTTTADSEFGEGNAQVYLEKGVTYRFCYRIRNGYTANNVLFSPMIRLASFTDGTYEPYNGVTVTIDLGETVYGGTLNPLTGVLTVDRAYTGLPSISGTALSGSVRRFYTVPDGPARGWQSVVLCDSLIGSDTYKYNAVGYASMSTDGRIVVTPQWAQNITTVADFNAALAEHPINLVIRLATPYEIQLTPQQVRSLYGNNTIYADAGNISLEYWAHP